MRLKAMKIVPIVLLSTLLAIAAADTPALARTARGRVLTKVNRIRSLYHLRRLDCSRPANSVAQTTSSRMASSRSMFHTTNLYWRLRARGIRPSIWGENVGYAPRWRRVVKLWMRSPGHRHNMLNGRFRRCGIGVASGGGRVWLTLVLYS
jgi:uncharacterized protein YkwD